MKRLAIARCLFALLIGLLGLPLQSVQARDRAVHLPYLQAGLNERQAVAWLLDRLSFGARPGDVDRVLATGLERWVQQQLQGGLPERELNTRLAAFPALQMTHQQMASRYPSGSLLSAHARRFHDLIPPAGSPVDFDWVRRKIDKFRQEQGILEDKILYDELTGQKIVRAVYSENQLTEVLTDFWTNHFYTTPTSFRARPWVLSYERDVIRPNVFGKFHEMLAATARHPAMLQYLENAQSALPTDEDSLMVFNLEKMRTQAGRNKASAEQAIALAQQELQDVEAEEHLILDKKFRPREGVNQHYARVLIELHTLGTDGAHTRQDVADAARAFSGWTTMPIGVTAEWFKGGVVQAQKLGFVRDGSFLFRADWHDAKQKHIFGKAFPIGGGIEEGEQVLDYLAASPATARHVTRKLAMRFVSEQPPEALLKRLATTFSESKGDLRLIMQILIESPEFWNASRERAKIKSPFELAASALRSVGAEVNATNSLTDWVARMGQPLYGYQAAPTGFPDRGDFWINAGTLQHRMNFAVNLGAGRIDGVTIDSMVLSPNRKPDSAEQALTHYAHQMLPERDVAQTIGALQPIVLNPRFLGEMDAVVNSTSAIPPEPMMMAESGNKGMMPSEPAQKTSQSAAANSGQKSDPMARVMGMIVGSPQFQMH